MLRSFGYLLATATLGKVVQQPRHVRFAAGLEQSVSIREPAEAERAPRLFMVDLEKYNTNETRSETRLQV